MSEVSAPWLHATLADAAESLAAALEKLEAHTDEETASELLRRDLVEVHGPQKCPLPRSKSSTPPPKKKSKKRLTPTIKPYALAIGRAYMGALKSEPPGFFV